MTDTSPPEGSNEFYSRQFLAERTGQIAARLRDAADRIERHAKDFDRIGQPGYTTYANVAGAVVKEITVALSNAPLDLVIATAGESDMYRAQRLGGGEKQRA